MRTLFLVLGLLFCMLSSSGQKKMAGVGGELSALSLKPTARMWFSKTSGLDLFAGMAAEFFDYKPNDYEGGIKYLHAFLHNPNSRSYLGGMAKWKWLKVEETNNTTNLPVAGLLIGKEWYKKKASWNGFAVELGYQYGVKDYELYNPISPFYERYKEFALIVNFRYGFYNDR